MCQSISIHGEGKLLNSVGDLADWLGVPVSELTVDDDYHPDQVSENNRDDCLCPIDIEYTLSRFKVWHRRDVNGDSMRVLAKRDPQ